MRRPFILIFILIILFSFFRIISYKDPSIDELFTDETEVTCNGFIYQITEKENSTAVYVRNVSIDSIAGQSTSANSDTRYRVLAYVSDASSFEIGNRISLEGKLQKLSCGTNPGQFNEKLYYKSNGIDYKLFAKKITLLDDSKDFYQCQLQKIRSVMKRNLEEYLPASDFGMMSAMTLGLKSELPQDTKEIFQKSGAAHILAISGLHITCIAMLLYNLLKKCYVPNETAIPLALFVIFSYGFMTDFSVSTNRAVVMLTILFCGTLLGRTYDFITAICLSGSIILLQNPYQLCNSGFLLSFGAVLGIAFVFPVLRQIFLTDVQLLKEVEKKSKRTDIRLLHWNKEIKQTLLDSKWMKFVRKCMRSFGESILLSVSIQLFTIPVLLFFYYDLPIYSIFLNLLILPCMSILLYLGLVLAFIGGFLSLPSYFVAGTIHAILFFYEKLCELCLSLPYSILTLGQPSCIQICIYYGVLGLFLFVYWKWNKKWIPLLFIPFVILFYQSRKPKLEITMLDVGQGDGILIEQRGGSTYFIDGGSTSIKDLEKYRLTPVLKSKRITTIDYAIITHLDQDHISGITALLEKNQEPGTIAIEHLVLPDTNLRDEAFESMVCLAEQQQVPIIYLSAGNKIQDGHLQFECLHPAKEFVTSERNDYSTVLQMQYHDFSMLLTGDVANEGERCVWENAALGPCEIYKVAHHGSKYTNSEELLQKISASYAIISAGKDNDYGHPHPELLDRLSDHACPYFCTIDQGAICIATDGEHYSIEGYKGTTDTLFPKKTYLGGK